MTTGVDRTPGANPLMIAVALGIVYVVWGSTYLAIRVVVRDLPATSSASWRYFVAAILLGAILCARGGLGRLRATPRELAGCAFVGLCLPALGNGLVSVGESHGAPSGVAALLVAAVPLWVIVYRAVTGDLPGSRTTLGVVLGFGGLLLLIASSGFGGAIKVGPCLVIMVATVFWSFGSWSTPRLTLPKDAFVLTAYEMLFGSFWLLAISAIRGEHMLPTSAPAEAWWAWVYLVTFGSVVAFTAYVWVLSAAPISLVATYAYVNPVVAVFLGWLILSEPVTLPIVIGGGIVVAAVAIVVAAERPARRQSAPTPNPEPESAPESAPEPATT
ncbi:MAG TPA: EamA family transporter [Nocardioidaceae bacterium]|nr:EamA family transporter [Nocardioidaceae bacterium]